MILSIITPTYNRAHVVQVSIDSALQATRRVGGEIIVVDDASSDGTEKVIHDAYPSELASGVLKYIKLAVNGGVTRAKNAGAGAASGEWLMFLDSDDSLIAEGVESLPHILSTTTEPIIFFPCRTADGHLVGHSHSADTRVSLSDYLNRALGECLPVVRRAVFLQHPYDEDLRGFEGLSYCRILKKHGPLLLSAMPLRIYDDVSADRLSTPQGLRRRSCLMARGHFRLLREFSGYFSPKNLVRQVAKIIYYSLSCVWLKMEKKISK